MQIHALFEWLVDPCIAFVRRNCKEVVATADVNLPVSLMNLFSSLLDDFQPGASGEPPVRCFSLEACLDQLQCMFTVISCLAYAST